MRKLIIPFLLASVASFAQSPVGQNQPDRTYLTALELFDKGHMGSARAMFERYASYEESPIISEDAQYYIAFAALNLFNEDGEYKIDRFVKEYPNNPKAELANLSLGLSYFREKNYAKAAEYLNKVDFSELNTANAAEGRFKLAYSLFARQQFDQALVHFNFLKRANGEYYFASNYYAGYIEYRIKAYDLALSDFLRAEKGDSYVAVVPYMLASVYYAQKDFDKLISYAIEALEKKEVRNKAELKLLLADGYFQTEDFEKSARYFTQYMDENPSLSDKGLQFKAGYAFMQMGDNARAIELFKNVALEDSETGQFASYYLGVLYQKEGNLPFAETAFQKAAQKTFNPKIQEEASFAAAKIAFTQGEYSDAIEGFKKFSKNYPSSSYQEEVNELLSEAYLSSNNYQEALAYMESIPNKSANIKKTYQRVAVYKGVELFNNANYYEAVKIFEKSLQFPMDKEWTAIAHFWMGEAYSIGKKYNEAINAYAAVFRQAAEGSEYFIRARYGIGYAYFNTKQYEKALTHFKEYTDASDRKSNLVFYPDAWIRLADCYYVNKLYNKAVETYNEAIQANNPDKDYALFQKGVIQSIQGNGEGAKSTLKAMLKEFPQSRYADDAEFQYAQIDFEQGNYEQAVKGFTVVINTRKQSPFVPYALGKRAIANYNLKNYSQTEADYKEVLEHHITHKTANSALLGLQEVLTLQNRSEEFEPYLTRYKNVNPENAGLASVEFESAKNLYFNQKYDKSISSFQNFLSNYPESGFVFEARYYLAESYYRANNSSEAIRYFEEVIADNQTPYIVRSMQRIAELEFKKGDYERAMQFYHRVLPIANTKKEQYNAWSGLMDTHYLLAAYDSVVYYAQIILERGNVSASAQNKASLYLGKAAFQQGNYEKATDEFLNTLNSARDEYGAEAQYLIALMYYNQKNYSQSLQSVYELKDKFATYEYWLGKAFLLIADNFIATGEIFQAKATLESIIEKSPVSSIVQEAQTALKKLNESNATAPQGTDSTQSN
ncbi:tetratricopeptide repeat protein [Cytophagales bacterium LB-30]|uniref:Tetratricopeptide repeat protein n=1 Tax=Shiella aurantiaca TaxID=3058365 RepID=A0ABT8F1E9_9BACT|nr:tetratricopeptide repeat protein [Shiella aurantiaca]MDN4164064.1 tetratricopeptide repeat protein [Shiella aurantiaca]